MDENLVSYRHRLSLDPATKEAYGAIMNWIMSQGSLHYPEDYIRRVRVPTLVVHGKQDKAVPLSSAFRLLELIEPSWGYIFPDCGHWAMMEHPHEFARVALDFILEGPRD